MAKNHSGFVEVNHTADVALKVWAENLDALFMKALEGMYQLIGISSNLERLKEIFILEFQEDDHESLLVTFLSECLFYLMNKGIMLVPDVLHISGNMMSIKMSQIKIEKITKEIKAVTYHDLKIIHDSGFQVVIVFDV